MHHGGKAWWQTTTLDASSQEAEFNMGAQLSVSFSFLLQSWTGTD